MTPKAVPAQRISPATRTHQPPRETRSPTSTRHATPRSCCSAAATAPCAACIGRSGPVGHDNLGGTAGAPKASGDPVGYYDPATDGHHVVYRGGDGHLHEMNWTGVAPVSYGGNLTGAVSAPRAVGNPAAYSGGGYNIVVYRATNGRIMSVYWQNGPSGLDDLSGTAGTPAAASDPAAYYTAHNDTHQIVYRAANGHLYELYWVGVHTVVGLGSHRSHGRTAGGRATRPRTTSAPRTPSTSSTARPTVGCTRSGGIPARHRAMATSRRSPGRRSPRTAPRGSPRTGGSTSRIAEPTTASTRFAGRASHEGDGHVEGTHITLGGHRNALRRQQVTGGDGSAAGDVDVALQRKLLAGIRFRR